MSVLVIIVLAWIVPIFVAQAIGKGKGHKTSWLWGLFLGWVGVLVVALQPSPPAPSGVVPAPVGIQPFAPNPTQTASPDIKKCPDCAELVQADAKICRFCGFRFDQSPETDTAVVTQ